MNININLKTVKHIKIIEESGSVTFHLDDIECWVCGNVCNHLTGHHTIPIHMRPVHNVIVPVCQKCHEGLNEKDAPGIMKFVYKATKKLNELVNYLKKKSINAVGEL